MLLPAALWVALASNAAAQGSSTAATLRVLDKVTARVSTIDAVVDQPVTVGNLRILVRSCQKNPPEETPESAAYIEIDDVRAAHALFRGWMFASSPGLNALEHPVYDVWVINCRTVPVSGSSPRP